MSRIATTSRATLADAYESAAAIAAGYIRNGVKSDQAAFDHGVKMSRSNQNWGQFIAGLARKMAGEGV